MKSHIIFSEKFFLSTLISLKSPFLGTTFYNLLQFFSLSSDQESNTPPNKSNSTKPTQNNQNQTIRTYPNQNHPPSKPISTKPPQNNQNQTKPNKTNQTNLTHPTQPNKPNQPKPTKTKPNQPNQNQNCQTRAFIFLC